jgi:hypothetical protein
LGGPLLEKREKGRTPSYFAVSTERSVGYTYGLEKSATRHPLKVALAPSTVALSPSMRVPTTVDLDPLQDQ